MMVFCTPDEREELVCVGEGGRESEVRRGEVRSGQVRSGGDLYKENVPC